MNNALTDNTIPTDTLCATPVKDEQRLRFWPQHFGRIPQWITLEPRIFAWMDQLCGLQRWRLGFLHSQQRWLSWLRKRVTPGRCYP
jgi:hypothetical protein